MLARRVLPAARSLPRTSTLTLPSRTFAVAARLRATTEAADYDPGLNGNYPNPPRVKRALRDPYGDWWDKQERRNYGEPIHEDNDILGIFTTEKYTWTTPGWGLVLWSGFIGCVFTLMGAVYVMRPEKPAVARTFELENELGGKTALIPPKTTGTNENSMQ